MGKMGRVGAGSESSTLGVTGITGGREAWRMQSKAQSGRAVGEEMEQCPKEGN